MPFFVDEPERRALNSLSRLYLKKKCQNWVQVIQAQFYTVPTTVWITLINTFFQTGGIPLPFFSS